MVKKAAVIGDPVEHSLSPSLFVSIQKKLGRGGIEYSRLKIPHMKLKALLQQIQSEPDWIGLNVTLPHKESLYRLLKDQTSSGSLTDVAKAVGAVNVISVREGQSLVGDNTDVLGLSRALEDEKVDLKNKRALIVGAGGAARASAYVLGQGGCSEVHIFNRTEDLAIELAQSMSKRFPGTHFVTGQVFSAPFFILVQTTSVGMGDGADPSSFYSELLRKLPAPSESHPCFAVDLIYTPEDTPFLKAAVERGFRGLGGVGMFVHQAIGTWESWMGPLSVSIRKELVIELKKKVRSILQSRKIFITGFMGAGKSTIGKILASRLQYEFLDTDLWIEKNAGKKVADLFCELGEEKFRSWENRAIEFACQMKQGVVALGGGSLSRPENLKKVKESGILVFLSATPQVLLKRILQAPIEERPLIDPHSADYIDQIENLLNERMAHYLAAQVQVVTDFLKPEEVVKEIEDHLEKIAEEE